MSPKDRIIDIFHQSAKQAGLQYLIIGGFAASFWGTARFTADIDYVISSSTFEKAKQVLEKLGYQLHFLHPKESFAHFISKDQNNFRIDLMIVNSDTWEKLFQEGQFGDFGGNEPYPVVSPMHLIAMKLHASSQPDRIDFGKDLNDIAEVMRCQKISWEMLQKAGILVKYGNDKNILELKRFFNAKEKKNNS